MLILNKESLHLQNYFVSSLILIVFIIYVNHIHYHLIFDFFLCAIFFLTLFCVHHCLPLLLWPPPPSTPSYHQPLLPTHTPLPYIYISYPNSGLLSVTTYPYSSPNIFSSIRLSGTLIPDLDLIIVLQKYLIYLINIPLHQPLLNKILIPHFLHILLHDPLMTYNKLTYTWHPQTDMDL